MKNALLILVLFLMGSKLLAQKEIVGQWDTGKHNSVVEIYQCDDGYFGKIVSSDNTKAKAGMPIIKDLKYSNGKWSALLYAVKRGEWYDAEIVEKGNELEITVSVGLFFKTISWSKMSAKDDSAV